MSLQQFNIDCSWPSANLNKKWGGTTKRDANWVKAMEEDQVETEPFPDSAVLNIGSHRDTPIIVQLEINWQDVLCPYGSGYGSCSHINIKATRKKSFPNAKFNKSTVKL